MVYRVYVEKKPGHTHEADSLLREAQEFLQIHTLSGVRVLNRYDVENIDEALFTYAVNTVFTSTKGERCKIDSVFSVCSCER